MDFKKYLFQKQRSYVVKDYKDHMYIIYIPNQSLEPKFDIDFSTPQHVTKLD